MSRLDSLQQTHYRCDKRTGTSLSSTAAVALEIRIGRTYHGKEKLDEI